MKNGILVGGNIEEQIIGSNIDTAFIVSGLDDNFSYKSQLNELKTLKDTRKCYDNIRINKLNKINKKRGYVEC